MAGPPQSVGPPLGLCPLRVPSQEAAACRPCLTGHPECGGWHPTPTRPCSTNTGSHGTETCVTRQDDVGNPSPRLLIVRTLSHPRVPHPWLEPEQGLPTWPPLQELRAEWPLASCLGLPSCAMEQPGVAQMSSRAPLPSLNSRGPRVDTPGGQGASSLSSTPHPCSWWNSLRPGPRLPPASPYRWQRHWPLCSPRPSLRPPSCEHPGREPLLRRAKPWWSVASLCWHLCAMTMGGNPGRPPSGVARAPGATGLGPQGLGAQKADSLQLTRAADSPARPAAAHHGHSPCLLSVLVSRAGAEPSWRDGPPDHPTASQGASLAVFYREGS